MALLWGIIFLAFGLSLAVAWSAQVLVVFKGIVPLLLLFLSAIFLVVGYSERKAARECRDAIGGEKDST